MRQIKFRGLVIEPLVSGDAWITPEDEYHEVYLNHAEKAAYINGHEVKYDSVTQYTGLTDKNGREIYEGDILEGFGKEEFRMQVVYREPCFSIKWFDEMIKSVRRLEDGTEPIPHNVHVTSEVIGNIYEDKRLLEV